MNTFITTGGMAHRIGEAIKKTGNPSTANLKTVQVRLSVILRNNECRLEKPLLIQAPDAASGVYQLAEIDSFTEVLDQFIAKLGKTEIITSGKIIDAFKK